LVDKQHRPAYQRVARNRGAAGHATKRIIATTKCRNVKAIAGSFFQSFRKHSYGQNGTILFDRGQLTASGFALIDIAGTIA
jgi:hypothetical protein